MIENYKKVEPVERSILTNTFKTLLIGTVAFYLLTHLSSSSILETISSDVRKISIDSIQVAYREAGQSNSKAVVFLHGFGGSSYDWKELMDMLSESYRCLAFDIPPFGLSEKRLDFDYSDESIVRLIMNSLNYLGVNRFVLVGHSMGGYLSLAIASLFPERVEKLILFDAAYANHSETLNSPNPPFELDNENQIKLYQILLAIGLKTYPLVKFLYQTYLSTGTILSTEHFEYLFAQNYFLPAEVLIKFTKDKAIQKPLAIDLASIVAKTLIIYGEKDSITPPSIGEYLSRNIRDSRLLLIPNEGHMPLANKLALEKVKVFLGE